MDRPATSVSNLEPPLAIGGGAPEPLTIPFSTWGERPKHYIVEGEVGDTRRQSSDLLPVPAPPKAVPAVLFPVSLHYL